jgi:hypothetical protein
MNHYPLGIRADEMTHLSLQIKCPCLLECEGDSPIVVCLVTEYHRSFDTIAIRTISHDKRGLLINSCAARARYFQGWIVIPSFEWIIECNEHLIQVSDILLGHAGLNRYRLIVEVNCPLPHGRFCNVTDGCNNVIFNFRVKFPCPRCIGRRDYE